VSSRKSSRRQMLTALSNDSDRRRDLETVASSRLAEYGSCLCAC
jgi:hypothetical protein